MVKESAFKEIYTQCKLLYYHILQLFDFQFLLLNVMLKHCLQTCLFLADFMSSCLLSAKRIICRHEVNIIDE